MSRAGDRHDSAVAESFFATLKAAGALGPDIAERVAWIEGDLAV